MGEKLPRPWHRMRLLMSLCYIVAANVVYFLSAVALGLHEFFHAQAEEFDTRAVELEAEKTQAP